MDHKVLIANRGEIALRIIRAARAVGIKSLSIYTEADASCPHVFQADETALISSYIDGSAIVALAKEKKATIINPGYGFLSENDEFASLVESSGIIWAGPTAESIQSMGLKHEARARAIKAQVPVLPGSELVDAVEEAVKQASSVGFPVMLKSSSGGGGMGMEVAKSEQELREAFQRTVDMSKTLFGNGAVFVEKFIPAARHIEIQVFGDGQGKVVHCGERECSAQRRNQKVLEEAGSPFIDEHPELRDKLCSAAVRLCELINYRSAGTVEFLVDDNTADFYFLELNARLQVEHPVTEAIRPGLDLSALMLKLAMSQSSSEPFSLPSQESLSQTKGHAIEARVYAEVPHLNFKPAPGLLQEVRFPSYPWLRVDTWVSSGSVISSFYDPMIAKVIAHGDTREEARARLEQALGESTLLGTATNVEYLRSILNCQKFVAGKVTTSFLNTFDEYRPACIEVVDGGLATSVQDLRPRLLPGGDGVPRGGAMDNLSAQAANALVGNPLETEVLEVTLSGPTLKFTTSTVVAVTGAEAEIFVDEDTKPLWTRFVVPAGSTLEIGSCEGTGSRAYIAIKGGLPSVPVFMHSKSTFSGGGLGGVQGRELVGGDILALSPTAAPSAEEQADFTLPSSSLPTFTREWKLAALPGPNADADYLLPEDLEALYSTTLTVSAQANRLGIRLEGLRPLKFSRKDGGAGGSHPSNTIEMGYSAGFLNMNGDTPVLLALDPPDAGGLICCIALVTVEWWKMGQLRPGDKVQFVEPSLAALPAHRQKQEEWVASLMTDSPLPFPADLETTKEKRSDGLLKVVESSEDDPKISFRQAGDGGILVEVGERALSFRTRLITELYERKLRESNLPSKQHRFNPHEDYMLMLSRTALTFGQGVASILFRFDPKQLSQDKLFDLLKAATEGLAKASTTIEVPARRIELPVAFNDSLTGDAVRRYMESIRKKAVYLPSNIEYLARATGVSDVSALVDHFCSSEWFVTARCFFLGLPLAAPLDKRALVPSQKYNPTRTYTTAGTLGLAGTQCAIYPVASPGGYQILGRTLSPWSPIGRFEGEGVEKYFLIRSFDVIKWVPTVEEEFAKIEKDFNAGSYTPKIENITLSAKEMAELEEFTRQEVEELSQRYKKNLAELAEEESVLYSEWLEEKTKEDEANSQGQAAGGQSTGVPLKSPALGTVRAIDVKIGDVLTSEFAPVKIEAMKTEISIRVGRRLVGKKVTGLSCSVGDVIKAGAPLLFCE
ncbi:bifunctional urea carboxylase/allophanate hydrolase [Sporobolomyces koalae]|uniref:bifunctional urea carboxylase/allophanate hydrolase n=1 Tax=Sporobolomyces koalae TaxID=500713 RepID=UPI00316B7520